MKSIILALSIIFAVYLIVLWTGTGDIFCIKVNVEVVDTPVLRQQGLSGREALEKDKGMFFVHEEESLHGYWMKDMNFPLDFVWIGDDMRIVGFEENVLPETYPEIFYPPQPVKYALEVNSGWVEKHKVKIGNIICPNYPK